MFWVQSRVICVLRTGWIYAVAVIKCCVHVSLVLEQCNKLLRKQHTVWRLESSVNQFSLTQEYTWYWGLGDGNLQNLKYLKQRVLILPGTNQCCSWKCRKWSTLDTLSLLLIFQWHVGTILGLICSRIIWMMWELWSARCLQTFQLDGFIWCICVSGRVVHLIRPWRCHEGKSCDRTQY